MTAKVKPFGGYGIMNDLHDIAREYGCNIEYFHRRGLFILYLVDAEGNRVGDDIWLRETPDGVTIDRVRAITLDVWRVVIARAAKVLKDERDSMRDR